MLKSDIRLGMRVRAIKPVDGYSAAVGLCGEVVLIPDTLYHLLVKFDQKKPRFHYGGLGYYDPTERSFFGYADEFIAIDESEIGETEIGFDEF